MLELRGKGKGRCSACSLTKGKLDKGGVLELKCKSKGRCSAFGLTKCKLDKDNKIEKSAIIKIGSAASLMLGQAQKPVSQQVNAVSNEIGLEYHIFGVDTFATGKLAMLNTYRELGPGPKPGKGNIQ